MSYGTIEFPDNGHKPSNFDSAKTKLKLLEDYKIVLGCLGDLVLGKYEPGQLQISSKGKRDYVIPEKIGDVSAINTIKKYGKLVKTLEHAVAHGNITTNHFIPKYAPNYVKGIPKAC